MAIAAATTTTVSPRRRTVRDAAGIGLATGVYGISFGVLAVAAGLTPAQACVMSMLTFTGASQFAFVGVLAAGGGALAALGRRSCSLSATPRTGSRWRRSSTDACVSARSSLIS